MNVENTNNEVPVTDEVKVELKKVVLENGEALELQAHEMAVLVTFDTKTGGTQVLNVQHCPLRGYAKMLLNEAMDIYTRIEIATGTARALEVEAQNKKKGFTIPGFGK